MVEGEVQIDVTPRVERRSVVGGWVVRVVDLEVVESEAMGEEVGILSVVRTVDSIEEGRDDM